jgi:hypothetical protein
MAIPADAWLDVMAQEYFSTFIPQGGGAVRFVVADAATLGHVAKRLGASADASGLQPIPLDVAAVRLHMLHTAVFAIAQALPWDRMLDTRLKALVADAGYRWPDTHGGALLPALAAVNGVAIPLIRRAITQALSRDIWQDQHLTMDFRNAMIALLDAKLTGDEAGVASAVMAWLHGTLRGVGPLKAAGIGRRITRQTARGILMSLCHWVRACGLAGMLLILDIRQLHRERRAIAEGLVYTPAAVMDCYEVLRQFIDDAEHFPGLFVAALADDAFVNDDPRRSLSQYTALQMRVWDDVRPQGGDNPLAPLVRLAAPAP